MATTTRLDIRITSSDWIGMFDTLEVWRSKLTEDGPFEEITAESYTPARIVSNTIGSLVNVAGLPLKLLTSGQVIEYQFTGVNPLTLAAIKLQLDGLAWLITSTIDEGCLILETAQAGLPATLLVLGGDAGPLLRLPIDMLAEGRDARIALSEGVDLYTFTDPHGDEGCTYKTRFRNRLTGAQSRLSSPVLPVAGAEPSKTARGFVRLIDATGRPLASHHVLVHTSFRGVEVDQHTVAGGAQSQLTDKDGYTEFRLVRGLAVTVAIAGTNLVRDLVVPADPAITLFNLLDPNLGSNDLFQVQVPRLDVAARRSLSG